MLMKERHLKTNMRTLQTTPLTPWLSIPVYRICYLKYRSHAESRTLSHQQSEWAKSQPTTDCTLSTSINWSIEESVIRFIISTTLYFKYYFKHALNGYQTRFISTSILLHVFQSFYILFYSLIHGCQVNSGGFGLVTLSNQYKLWIQTQASGYDQESRVLSLLFSFFDQCALCFQANSVERRTDSLWQSYQPLYWLPSTTIRNNVKNYHIHCRFVSLFKCLYQFLNVVLILFMMEKGRVRIDLGSKEELWNNREAVNPVLSVGHLKNLQEDRQWRYPMKCSRRKKEPRPIGSPVLARHAHFVRFASENLSHLKMG